VNGKRKPSTPTFSLEIISFMNEAGQDRPWPEPIDLYNRYQVGVTVWNAPKGPDEVRFMLFLVTYDIACPKRLRRVAKTCAEYGVRVEKSVFECDLPHELFQRLWCELMDLVDEDNDALIAYRICATCLKEVESIGQVPRPEKPVCYIL
jgi:CRISPR-associated protein Cas2